VRRTLLTISWPRSRTLGLSLFAGLGIHRDGCRASARETASARPLLQLAPMRAACSAPRRRQGRPTSSFQRDQEGRRKGGQGVGIPFRRREEAQLSRRAHRTGRNETLQLRSPLFVPARDLSKVDATQSGILLGPPADPPSFDRVHGLPGISRS
jgi:hypothetical protein